MVKPITLCCLLLITSACGSLYDGAYVGDARFVLDGTVLGLAAPPAGFDGSVLVHVQWQLITKPAAPTETSSASDGAGAESPTSGSAAAPGSPAGSTGPTTPTAPALPPTVAGTDGAVGSVHFPAPLTLSLYDRPTAADGELAAVALGAMSIFYDVDGDGVFSAADTVAGVAPTQQLLYVDGGSVSALGVTVDNGAAVVQGYNLVDVQCPANTRSLHVIPNTTVPFVAGSVVACP